MQQRRVREPGVSAGVYLLGLSLQVVQDVQGELHLLVDPVVVLDGSVLVCGQPNRDEAVGGRGEGAQLLNEPAPLLLSAFTGFDGRRQAVRHDRQHDAPAVRHLGAQPLVKLLQPRGQGREAARAVLAKDPVEDRHLCQGISGFGIHDDEVPSVHRIVRAGGVQQQELAAHPRASIPLGVRQRHAADLGPARRWNCLQAPTMVPLQHVTV
mmetsp:Transcript_22922/g.46424  ORF Transcript_22922/g.46424 Transcript_22922/m.46424 type:complete len:210 (+) Transcript_22922:651-1280(+)